MCGFEESSLRPRSELAAWRNSREPIGVTDGDCKSQAKQLQVRGKSLVRSRRHRSATDYRYGARDYSRYPRQGLTQRLRAWTAEMTDVTHAMTAVQSPWREANSHARQKRPESHGDDCPLPAESVGRSGVAGKPLVATAYGRLGTSFESVRGAGSVCRWSTDRDGGAARCSCGSQQQSLAENQVRTPDHRW